MSYKPEFCCQGQWCDNGERWATAEEARRSAAARFAAWTMPSDYRVTETPDPVTYFLADDGTRRLLKEVA